MNEIQLTQERLSDAVKDLFYWQHENSAITSPSFASLLYLMIQKADFANRARLRIAFPAHCHVWELWLNSPSQEEFFMAWGINIKQEKANGISR